MNCRRYKIGLFLAGLLAAITLRMSLAADAPVKNPPAVPPASKYAPADDLLGQVDLYLQHLDETIANQADFDDGAKSRLKKDATTLAVLFDVLDQHDTENRFQGNRKQKALAVVALEIANAADFAAASA
ncbi:MAG TPA: hypothetical protein VGJ15_01865, partial [Pirellulales bacterium]